MSFSGVLGLRFPPRSSNANGVDEGRARDADLLQNWRRKDRGSFERLVRAHQDRVFDFCFRMLADREEAFELSQDIFLSVHQHLGEFREDSRLSTWILRISKNHCLNRLKYLKRRGAGRSDELSEVSEERLLSGQEAQPTPDRALEQRREQQKVRRAVAMLEQEHRLVVVLRDLEGLTYEEIMDITDLPEGTVKSRLHRARAELTRLLSKPEDGPKTGGDSSR